MSIEAINWALNDAPDVPPHLVSTLFGLANHAHADGRNAYISVGRLAKYTRKTPRAAQKDMRELERLGLIELGDQRVVEHYRIDRRPTVYNLCMSGVNHRTPRESGGVSCGTERGELQGQSGVSCGSPKPHREPQEEPKRSASFVGVRANARTTLDQDSTVEDIEALLGRLDASEAGLAQGMIEQGKHPRFVYNTLRKQREEVAPW